MIELNFETTSQESAQATIDFMSNRPIGALMFRFMQSMCILLCVGYGLMLYSHSTRLEDTLAVIAALAWLLAYKHINRWIVVQSLKIRKFSNVSCICKIDEKSILYQLQANQPLHIEWKKLKFVLKNKNGYIIPLTGASNAGKFMWLPLRSLHSYEPELLDLIAKFKLKIKKV